MKNLYTLLASAFLSSASLATIRNVPASYSTVQAALAACVAGDTILVQPGTYTGNITWPNIAGIKLLSAGDSTNTILNGTGSGSVMTFSQAAIDTNTLIKGFKITGGHVTGSAAYGGGILIFSCSPRFYDVNVTGNHLSAQNWGYGAGVYGSTTKMVFRNSSISYNKTDTATWGYGGGVFMTSSLNGNIIFSNVKISGNVVNSNTWCYGIGVHCDHSDVLFTNVSVTGNTSGAGANYYYGGGIFLTGGTYSFTNVLVASNRLNNNGFFYQGGGISADQNTTAVTMMNVTVTDNSRVNGGNIYGTGFYSGSGNTVTITNSVFYDTNPGTEIDTTANNISITYSDIHNGFTGTGNINSNPNFVSATDFHLTASSPCINAGTLSGAPSDDLDGNSRPLPVATNPDMGCYEFDQVPTGIAAAQQDNPFSAFPNPFHDNFNIAFSVNSRVPVDFEFVDLSGKTVLKISKGMTDSGSYSFTPAITDLTPGIYFCKMIAGEKMSVVKIVKE